MSFPQLQVGILGKRTRKQHRENIVGPWAAEKLNALKDYLNFYTAALSKQNWQTIYIDAFAGAGTSRLRPQSHDPHIDHDLGNWLSGTAPPPDKDRVQLIKGSPRLALELKIPFDKYVFIDADSDRIAQLKLLRSTSTRSADIGILESDASEALIRLGREKINRSNQRAVAFIDPYGAHISWEAISALADTQATEVFINFPWAMTLNRLMTTNPDIPENWKKILNDFFGTDAWQDIVYVEKDSLFGPQIQKSATAETAILKFYRDRLKKAFGFVSSARLIRNSNNGPLYYLIWAGPNKLGLRGAEHVLGQGEKLIR